MDFFYKAAGAVLAPFRYAEREVKHAKENFKEDAQAALAKVLKLAVMVFCSLLFLLFISITAAMAINRSMESEWAGFAIVAGFYLLVGIAMYIWKEVSEKKHEEHQQHRNTVGV
ncbi:MAG TPA: phage holin family protein [Chryseosolibacter sp.]|nr:phage holin family protein [Chryseosolibacter sp.]